MADQLIPFLFERLPIRGAVVSLTHTWQEVAKRHAFPAPIEAALGEMMAASALLSATLKREGALVMQIHAEPGSGSHAPLELVVVECKADLTLRATAKWSRTQLIAAGASPRALVGEGRFVITLDAGDQKTAYQGIVPLEGETISTWLTHYMRASEQLETGLWLASSGDCAAGLLLQRLPNTGGSAALLPDAEVDEAWHRITTLAATVRPDELLGLDGETLLNRLFHEDVKADGLRVFERRATRFGCSCNSDRVASMLRMLGRSEVDSVIAEQGAVTVHCNFCNQGYAFEERDVARVFAPMH